MAGAENTECHTIEQDRVLLSGDEVPTYKVRVRGLYKGCDRVILIHSAEYHETWILVEGC